mmetsp:Transcript_8978/g.20575  ORF Transcript_8978/g.20575 Transcript_8978/m.20575 type:complete len:217 (-) Transcript_8978:155-805(-)
MEDDLGIPNQPDCVDSCPDTKLLLERLRKILQRPEYAMMQIFRSQAIETPVDILREACEVLSKLSIPNQQEEISIPSEGLIRDGLLSSSRMLVFSVRLPQWTVMEMGRGMREFTMDVPWKSEADLRLSQLIHPGDKVELERLVGGSSVEGQGSSRRPCLRLMHYSAGEAFNEEDPSLPRRVYRCQFVPFCVSAVRYSTESRWEACLLVCEERLKGR